MPTSTPGGLGGSIPAMRDIKPNSPISVIFNPNSFPEPPWADLILGGGFQGRPNSKGEPSRCPLGIFRGHDGRNHADPPDSAPNQRFQVPFVDPADGRHGKTASLHQGAGAPDPQGTQVIGLGRCGKDRRDGYIIRFVPFGPEDLSFVMDAHPQDFARTQDSPRRPRGHASCPRWTPWATAARATSRRRSPERRRRVVDTARKASRPFPPCAGWKRSFSVLDTPAPPRRAAATTSSRDRPPSQRESVTT